MKEKIGADDWTIETLRHGLKVVLREEPKPFEKENNNSARKYMKILKEKVDEWETKGYVKKLLFKPKYVNAMSVIRQENSTTKEIKFRPVIDMKTINNLVLCEKTKLDDLTVVEPMLEEGDFMASFDLENMYFHVKLHPESIKYFGFSLPGEQGESIYYQFTIMCYGFNQAVQIATRITKPLKAWLHEQGIRAAQYLDDNLTLGKDKLDCEFKFKLSLLIFQLAGWKIQWKKTSKEPEQRLLFLGFIIDTVQMKFFAAEEKLANIEKLMVDFLMKIVFKCSFNSKDVAGLLGKIQSLRRSHGPVVGIMSRSTQHQLGKFVTKNDWTSGLVLNNQCFEELNALKNELKTSNGQFIQNSCTAGKIFELEEVSRMVKTIETTENKVENLMVSDASETSAFVYHDGQVELINDHEFDNFEKSTSSGHRELLAVIKTLESEQNSSFFTNLINRRLYWQTDSKNSFIFMSRGSRVPSIQKDVFKLKTLEKRLNLQIVPVWTSRNHNRIVLADLGSKFSQSTDEWGVSRDLIQQLFSSWGLQPTVDCFASSSNTICKKFFSKIPQIGSSGVNFFVQDLKVQEIYFCCPPTKLVGHTWHHLLNHKEITAILICPAWKSANYWPLLFQGPNPHKNIKEFRFFSGRFQVFNQVKSIFSKAKFMDMVAILLKTD